MTGARHSRLTFCAGLFRDIARNQVRSKKLRFYFSRQPKHSFQYRSQEGFCGPKPRIASFWLFFFWKWKGGEIDARRKEREGADARPRIDGPFPGDEAPLVKGNFPDSLSGMHSCVNFRGLLLHHGGSGAQTAGFRNEHRKTREKEAWNEDL